MASTASKGRKKTPAKTGRGGAKGQGGLCILQAQSDCTELISRTLPLEAAD